MRFIFRGISIGLLAGALFFFFPFLLGILLFIFIIRFAFGWGWRRHRNYGPPSFYPQSGFYNDIISIDGSGYVPPVQGKGGEQYFPVQ